ISRTSCKSPRKRRRRFCSTRTTTAASRRQTACCFTWLCGKRKSPRNCTSTKKANTASASPKPTPSSPPGPPAAPTGSKPAASSRPSKHEFPLRSLRLCVRLMNLTQRRKDRKGRQTVTLCKNRMTPNEAAAVVVDVALAIHRKLGPGLLESVYLNVLTYELRKRGLHVATEVPIPVIWEDIQ